MRERRILSVTYFRTHQYTFFIHSVKSADIEYSLEGLMLKLKLQYFGHFKRRTDSLENTFMLGEIEGRRKWGRTEDEMAGWHH